MPPPIAYFGIESKSLSLVIDLLILFVVVLYFSLLYWTYADARRRIADPALIVCATAASLFPFVGTIVYMILRPPEYLEDVRERELELQAAEARLHDLDYSLCPHCDYRVERDFIRCPSCLRKLKERCTSCSRPLDRAWTICPYCETEVVAVKPARRTTKRERPPTQDSERAPASKSSSRVAVETDSEARADSLEAQPASAARVRAAERAAAKAPELTGRVEAEQEPEPAAAPSRGAPSRRAPRPRSST
jgi:uncharacterized Zn finger protein (UPF0148 family)